MSFEAALTLALIAYLAAFGVALAGFRWASARQGPWQLLCLAAAFGLQTVGIALHCVNSATHFFTSLSEILLLLSWAMALGNLLVLAFWSMRSLGIFLLPLVILQLVTAHFVHGPGRTPVGELARHPLFAVHVLSAFLGYGLFLTACAASVLYLQEQRLLKRKLFHWLFNGMPSLERLERAETACSWTGLLLFTVAVGTGAVMASQSGAAYWYLEPKILATQATWLVFLVFVLGRLTGRLAGRASATWILVGAALVLFTFLMGHPFREPAQTGRVRPDPHSPAVSTALQIDHCKLKIENWNVGDTASVAPAVAVQFAICNGQWPICNDSFLKRDSSWTA